MESFDTKLPLSFGKNSEDRIKCMAFDGCSYYFLTACSKKIIKTDMNYKIIGTYKACREYCCLCYDFKEHCFWAATAKNCNKIFKLNCSLTEIDCLTICNCKFPPGIITGISYNCCCDSLLVTLAGYVAEVNKISGEALIKYKTCDMWITSILSLCPGFIITAIICGKQYIYIFNSAGAIINSYCVEHGCIVHNIIFNPCSKSSCEPLLEFLITCRGCYSYIAKVSLAACDLGFIPQSCNYLICGESCSDCPSGGGACTDVMESIALVETALSHILNAEGEKLQKVLACTDDLDKILCVNKEINRTIINATHLEHTLYAKLSMLKDCCYHDSCDPKCEFENLLCEEICEESCEEICNEICDESCGI